MPHLKETLNQRGLALLEAARPNAPVLGLDISTLSNGAEVFHFGTTRRGTFAAGVLLAEICMADLAKVSIGSSGDPELPVSISVTTDHPLLACMASQYAGWPLSVEKYFAMCSGPARAARGKEAVLDEYNLNAKSKNVVAVLESSSLPNATVAAEVASQCNVKPENVTLCVARTASLPGTLQVVARSIETSIHKLHELKFDLNCLKNAFGSAPMPPIAKKDLTSLGWTNDAVLYGATVQLFVDCEDETLESIGPKVPSCSSDEFGTPFLEIFERYEMDFYKIDKMLFSPARVIFNNLQTGNVFAFGKVRPDVLRQSWGLKPTE